MADNDDKSTIMVSKNTKHLLDNAKKHPRETYEDVLVRLLGGRA